jgi:hypothetical protein
MPRPRPAPRASLAPLDGSLAREPAGLDVAAGRVLRGLFELARADRHADASSLGRLLGMRPSQVGCLLSELDARGLVRAERARLTLAGLALAARLAPLAGGVLEVPSATRSALRRSA